MRANLRPFCVLMIVLAASAMVWAETKEFTGQSTEGWLVWIVNTGQQANDKLTSSDGWLRLKYDRSEFVLLAHMTPVTGLKELKVEIKSDVDAIIGFGVEDQDKARFHYPVQLTAGKETTVTIKPEDFKLNDDSPTKKDKLEPEKLGNGYLIADLGLFVGATGENTLHIWKVTISRN